MRTAGWILCLFLIFAGCDQLLLGDEDSVSTIEENMEPPELLNDGLNVSSLEAEGFDVGEIRSLIEFFHDVSSTNQRSVLILKNNKLVLEAYLNGWNRHRKQDMRSASKNFTSALVGMAIDKGYIQGVNEPIIPFFNEYDSIENWDPRKSEMTIEDFLRMRTGLRCNDWFPSSPGNEEKMYKTDDWVKFILDLPVSGNPGQNFSYCTGAPVTLGTLISNASGMNVSDFADQFLFKPLGIHDYSLEYQPNGVADTGGHFHMKPRDMAKFGLLYLNDGNWKGEQLISADWITQSTMPYGAVPRTDNVQFGYLWWTTTWTIENQEIPGYFANGNGGQHIFVIPSQQLVIVLTGGRYNSNHLPAAINTVDRILNAL